MGGRERKRDIPMSEKHQWVASSKHPTGGEIHNLLYFAVYNVNPHFWPKLSEKKNLAF